jgi:hypothetical protein
VNLEGWSLTDERANLKKWRFPSTVLPPSEYLIVFASKKNRRVPNGELHTNFKLKAGGDYLALVKPDGVTVASEFAPAYPPQITGASYGLSMSDRSATLLSTGAALRVMIPTGDIGLNWLNPDFDDSGWMAARNGVGFEAGTNYAAFLGTNLRSSMLGKSASAYVRVPFIVPEVSFEKLKLRLRYDDGFVAYLNGWEVARRNAPRPAQWNSTATAGHGSVTASSLEENFDGETNAYVLSQLEGATRPKISSASEGTAGRFLRLVNGRITNQVNSIAFPLGATGAADTVIADFDFRCKGTSEGTDRLAFLLVPASVYGRSGEGVSLATLRDMKEPNLPGVFALVILQNSQTRQAAVSLYWDGTRRLTANLPGGLLGSRQFHHVQIRLQHGEKGAQVTASFTADANGRKQTITPINDTFVAGLRPFEQRVQFAARSGQWDHTIDLDSIRVQSFAGPGGAAEEFDLSGQIDLLKPGTNWLALHGLNRAANDPGFLLLPELIVGYGAVQTNAPLYFATPTPRAVNRDGYTAVSPTPEFSERAGVFAEAVSLQMKAGSGIVHYTLDGSEPTANSRAYSGPIVLEHSTIVKARTFTPGLLPSAMVTENYTLLDPEAARFTSNLPLIILNSHGQYLSPYNKVAVSIRFIDIQSGRASLSGPADFDGRASINIRGHSTIRQSKSSYTVRLKDDHDDKVKASLFGLPKDSDWVLYAPFCDKTLIRDALAYDLSNQMGRYAPRTRFVEVFLERSGGRLSLRDYIGVYVLEEKIKRGKHRVNIEEMTSSDNTEPAISGGYIFKRDHSMRFEPSFNTSLRHVPFMYVEPKGQEITREQKLWLSQFMNQFERALYGADFADPQRGYAKYLDVDSFIDQHWLIEMSKNIDGFRYSAFLHKDRGGKLQVGPAWDWNLSFGNADYHEGWKPDSWYTEMLRENELCWYRRLSEDPEFMQRCIDRWGDLRRNVFAPSNILARVDQMAAQLREGQARNFRRWPILGRNINPNYFVGDTYEEEINWMKKWIQRRIAWIDNQFPAPPQLSRPEGPIERGTTITLRGGGKIYYTLDGTDPRLRGGAVSPKARAYSGPIKLQENASLFARAHQGNGWSSPTSIRYDLNRNGVK